VNQHTAAIVLTAKSAYYVTAVQFVCVLFDLYVILVHCVGRFTSLRNEVDLSCHSSIISAVAMLLLLKGQRSLGQKV